MKPKPRVQPELVIGHAAVYPFRTKLAPEDLRLLMRAALKRVGKRLRDNRGK